MPDEKKKELATTKKETQVAKENETAVAPKPTTLDTTALKNSIELINRLLLNYHQSPRSSLADDYWSLLLKSLRSESGEVSARDRIARASQLRPQVGQLESEISKLKAEINQKAEALLERTVDAKQKERQIQELEGQLQSLGEKQRLSHLLSRVGNAAQQKLLDSPEFRSQFDGDSPCPAYVLSIDIRRSTELMLKAREPKLFAQFLISLASKLRDVVLENYGIFDKFTGDGILAFFPEFYSGADAGYFALKAAGMCHQVFAEHYDKHKHCFVSVLKDIGLGIGLDYGLVQIVQLGGDFTVVGTPVVYACRMAGAQAGHTYLNQPAFERLFEKYSSICDFDESEIDIKHEGLTLAYRAEPNGKTYSPKLPDWNTPSQSVEAPKSVKK